MTRPLPEIQVAWSEEDKCYLARCPAFPSLVSHGDTPSEAIYEEESVVVQAIKMGELGTIPNPARDRQRDLLVQELLHGAYLAGTLLSRVGDEVEGDKGDKSVYAPVWKKHPETKVAFDKAVAAVWEFYQTVGKIDPPP